MRQLEPLRTDLRFPPTAPGLHPGCRDQQSVCKARPSGWIGYIAVRQVRIDIEVNYRFRWYLLTSPFNSLIDSSSKRQ